MMSVNVEGVVRNAGSHSVKSLLKGRKALHPVQQTADGDQVVTPITDRTIDISDKAKCEKILNKETVETMGKENLKNIKTSVNSDKLLKSQSTQQKNKPPKKKLFAKKTRTPKHSSSQPSSVFKSSEDSAPEVTPGYEWLIADPAPAENALSKEELHWKEMAEVYQGWLQFAECENKELREELEALEKENETLLQALEYGSQLADLVEEYKKNEGDTEDAEERRD